MAFQLFELFGSIMVDNEKANESIAKTESKAEGLGNKLAGGIATAGKWGLAIGAAAGAAGGALFGVATKSAEATDRIDKMSQKLGMNKTQFQEWDYILGQNGVSIDSLGGGMKTLTNMTDDLSKGSAAAKYSFGELGVSLDDLKGKTQEEIFDLTVKKLMEVEDTTKRAALANDLLGKAGAELAPVLNAGADSAEALRARAHELGLVLEDDAITAGVVFGDTMDDLKRSMGAAAAQIGVELMPMFQNLMDWVLAHMPEIQTFMSEAFRIIGAAVKIVWDIFSNYLLPVLETVFKWVKSNLPTFQKIFKDVFEAVSDVVEVLWEWFIDNLLPIFKEIFDWVSENWPTFQKIFETVFDAIATVLSVVWDIVANVLLPILGSLFTWALEKTGPLRELFAGAFGKIAESIEAVWTWISVNLLPAFSDIYDWAKDKAGKVGEWVSGAFDTIFGAVDKVVTAFKNLKDSISEALNKWDEWLDRPEDDGGSGGFGGISDNLPKSSISPPPSGTSAPTGRAPAGRVPGTANYNVTIDAKNVRELTSVTSVFSRMQQTVRQGV